MFLSRFRKEAPYYLSVGKLIFVLRYSTDEAVWCTFYCGSYAGQLDGKQGGQAKLITVAAFNISNTRRRS